MKSRILISAVVLFGMAAGAEAQSIRDQYGSKAEACEVTDGNDYRDTEGYRRYGQIGWEQEVGWRPIQNLERYESEHRKYNINSFVYCQVWDGDKLLDDCEIVAVNESGYVVGNQCPEPHPLKAGDFENVAIMAVFGEQEGEVIRFKVITGIGTADDPLVEKWAEEVLQFVPNGTTGLTDSDGDGKFDSWDPMALHIGEGVGIRHIAADASTTPATHRPYSILPDGRRTSPQHKGLRIDWDGNRWKKVWQN